jgi:hypothetical protein
VRPRPVALGVGVLYALLTAVELLIGDWTLGDTTLLQRTTKANLLHWALALALLGGYFAGERASRLVCRIAGAVFAVLGVWGLASAASLGDLLGYQDGIPVIYSVLHVISAILCIFAGFGRTPRTA